jgi:hypothetical protein
MGMRKYFELNSCLCVLIEKLILKRTQEIKWDKTVSAKSKVGAEGMAQDAEHLPATTRL